MLAPKQVAEAIGVSESSVKRWTDAGLIPVYKTPGGHRKLRADDVVRYLVGSRHRILRPALLGLPGSSAYRALPTTKAFVAFDTALEAGNDAEAMQIVLALMFSGTSVDKIVEEVLVPAYHLVGTRWECGDWSEYQERSACGTGMAILQKLRELLPPPESGARRALGATLNGDHYGLALSMGALLLASRGWAPTVLGSNLPAESVALAVRREKPAFVWLSLSYAPDIDVAEQRIQVVAEACGEEEIDLMFGGRAVTDALRSRVKGARFGARLSELPSD